MKVRFNISIFLCVLLQLVSAGAQTNTNWIPREVVRDAQKLIGLDFPDAKLDQMIPRLKNQLDDYEALHKFPLSNSVPSAMMFNPIPVGMKLSHERSMFKARVAPNVKMPAREDELAFYSVTELAALIKSRR